MRIKCIIKGIIFICLLLFIVSNRKFSISLLSNSLQAQLHEINADKPPLSLCLCVFVCARVQLYDLSMSSAIECMH